MQIDFNLVVADVYNALLVLVVAGWIVFWQPLIRVCVLLTTLREMLLSWYARFAGKLMRLSVERTFNVEKTGNCDSKEAAIVIMNHQSFLDFALLYKEADQQHVDLFFFVYKEVVRLPTLGTLLRWYRGAANWRVASEDLSETFREFAESKSKAKWLVLFPEVEMWDKNVQQQHRTLCEVAGCNTMTYLLYPRFGGFRAAVEQLRPNIKAVYDFTTVYRDPKGVARVPQIEELANQRGQWGLNMRIERYDMSDIPYKAKDVDRWLERVWFQKDAKLLG